MENATMLFEGGIPGISVEQIRREGNFSMRQHFHSYYEIYYLLEGERNYFIKDRTYHVYRGNLIFVNSGQIHKTTMVSPAHERILLVISKSLIDEFSRKAEESDPPFSARSGVLKLTEPEQRWVEILLFRIIEEIREKRSAYEQEIQALLQELLIFILRKDGPAEGEYPSVKSAKHRKVNEVANFICANFAEISSLDRLSERFYISKYYLCRIFKEVTGMTISQYINANRLKAAEKMLRESSDSVTHISAVSGFGSVTYFNKVFRESLGITPVQYRKSNRNR